MNFDEAIKAHADWKLKLRNYISKTSTEKFDAKVVAQDNQCALGKWIYGEGKTYQSDPDYKELKEAHAKFHKCAASIVTHCDAGTASLDMLGNNSEFYKYSLEVVTKISNIRKKAQKAP
jgi:hypothetical protein